VTGGHLAIGTAGTLGFAKDVRLGSDGGSVEFGAQGATGAAQSGFVRGPYSTTSLVSARGSTGTFDVPVVRYTTGDVPDTVIVGGGTEGVRGLQLETTSGSAKIKIATIGEYEFSPVMADWQQNDLRNVGNVGIPSGYLQMGPTASSNATWIVNPGNIVAILAGLPAGGGTLLLSPGNYGVVNITQTGSSQLTLAAFSDSTYPIAGTNRPNIAIGWFPTNTPTLTLSGIYLNGNGSNALNQNTSANTNLFLNDCLVTGTVDVRLGGMVTCRGTESDSILASSLILKDGSRIRGAFSAGTATRVEMSQVLTPAATVQTSVGTLAMDQYSLDFFGASRSKLGGSGPMRAIAGPQFGGVLPDANANVSAPTGTVWFVPGTNSADRTYTLGQVGVTDGMVVAIENRDSSANAKIISTVTGTPSGTIATLAANMGQIFKHTALVGWNPGSRYQL